MHQIEAFSIHHRKISCAGIKALYELQQTCHSKIVQLQKRHSVISSRINNQEQNLPSTGYIE